SAGGAAGGRPVARSTSGASTMGGSLERQDPQTAELRGDGTSPTTRSGDAYRRADEPLAGPLSRHLTNPGVSSSGSRFGEDEIASARNQVEKLTEKRQGVEETAETSGMDYGLTDQADELLERRLKREPLAYILGYKEFYGRDFKVTPDVLIPRPDTETMIELLSSLLDSGDSSGGGATFRHDRFKLALQGSATDESANLLTLIDIGTGSGAIAITAKLEFPSLQVSASDISPAALRIAMSNAKKLGADIEFLESDLLSNVQRPASIICANLPYVDEAWQTSPETRFEPDMALFAPDGGLKLISELVFQATERQSCGDFMILEADPRQHHSIIELAHRHDYDWYESRDFMVVLQKN
ncbi:MAG TPA: HemK family protein methyltransferase, partial [Candidatus Saccharimonadales bacterium]|nr:HemK family protein methyltransferase [Candidatus Saccharimonadales bacterium]